MATAISSDGISSIERRDLIVIGISCRLFDLRLANERKRLYSFVS
jgi:hypothetical protein